MSTILLSLTHSTNSNGPVPTGFESKSWPESIRLFGRMAAQPDAKEPRKGACGEVRLKTTVRSSGVSIEEITANSLKWTEPASSLMTRSKVALNVGGRERIAVMKSYSGSQLESPAQVIVRDLPAFCKSGNDLAAPPSPVRREYHKNSCRPEK